MNKKKNNNTRSFSSADSVLYNGALYPSSTVYMDNGNGVVKDSKIFMDSNGQYYTMGDNGMAYPVMLQHDLPEVEVKPSQEEMLSRSLRNSLTLSQDNARVSNPLNPYESFNTHLRERALRGAREHALWDKEHPNLSTWRDFATAVPFGIAATPLIGGLGETALGQATINGAGKIMSKPAIKAMDSALGLGFGTKGAYDVSQGDVTPSTLLELTGFYPFAKSLTGLSNKVTKTGKSIEAPSISENVYDKIKHSYPLKGETEIPIDIKAEITRKYTDFINSEEYLNRLRKANLEDHWEYMKELTDRRLNNIGYFPGKVKAEINNNPEITGLSSVEPSSKNYGITLQEDLPLEEVFHTGYHEAAHWATGNAGIDDMANIVEHPFLYDPEVNKIGDIMRYNESIAPVKEWDEILQTLPKDIPIDRVIEIQDTYNYLIGPQEIRARLYNIYQQAKDSGMSVNAFVDKFTRNGRITSDAPMNLQQLGEIFTIDNLKKRLNNFLGISAPIGLGIPTLNNQQNGQSTFRR